MVIFVLLLLLGLAVAFSLGYGHGFRALWDGMGSQDGFGYVLRRIRIPRTLIALMVGGALAASGTTLQSVLRNPLAEPYTLGLSGGASLGIAIAGVLGLQRQMGPWVNPLFGFLGGMASAAAVYALSRRRLFQPTGMVLFGIVTSLVFSSVVFLLFSLMDPDRMQTALMWLMGDLSALDVSLVPLYLILFVIPLAVLFFYGKEIDILSLGPEKARYLGVDPGRMYRLLFVLTSILTGLSVSAAGIIGFVGLIVPHILREVCGPRHGFLLIASFLGGAFFLIGSDVISRYIVYPLELPVGVVTGILGGLLLLVLVLRRTR
jgi:iron complex transport system permease protein